MSILPFASKPKTELAPVGDPETGLVYLRRGAPSPNESTVDIHKNTIRAIQVQKIVRSVCEKMSAELGITKKQARERLFDMQIKPATAEQPEQASAEVADDDKDPMELYYWMTPEQVDQFLAGGANQEELRIKSVTLMIKNRIAYPVTLIANAKEKASELYVDTGIESIEVGSQIKFGNIKVSTVDGYSGGDTLEVSPLSCKLSAGMVGFLLDEQGLEKLGDPKWTVEKTKELPEPLIDAIYYFYQSEAGMLATIGEDEDAEGELMTSSTIESSTNPLLTGSTSTGDSNTSDAEMSA